MRSSTISLFFAVLVLLATAVSSRAGDQGWPRRITDNGNTLIIYQPQVDNWKNFSEIDLRMAISLTPGGRQPVVGIVVLSGENLVDQDSSTVLITALEIRETRFPSLNAAQAAEMNRIIRTFLPKSVDISLPRLIACVAKKESGPGVELNNKPPEIFVSDKPAILLDVDGEPVRAQVQDTGLEYVVNTHWPLFFDRSSRRFYLPVDRQWLTAPELQGPWAESAKLPAEMDALPEDPRWAELKDIIPPPARSPGPVPTVYFSTVPAEVILFDGAPAYAEIPGTRLKYATNTVNYLFLDTSTNLHYFLTAGRWFRSGSLNGPWTFATPDLPDDFRHIPGNHPAAQVLASVPGTPEAEDTVLLAKIPRTVIVNPTAASAEVKVAYDGAPRFAPIEQTDLSYATNTSQKVIKAGDLYYLCLQGLWFVATTPQGPWKTAPSVPRAIYTIPPSSPVYNVTYVTQTTSADGSVHASYTSGYTGVYVMSVATGVVAAIGTGYDYAPYVAVYPADPYRLIYYPTPYTYGARSYYNAATGAYGISQTAYGPYGTATRSASYNPYTGTYARTASVSSAFGRAAVGQAYNPYTGAYGATRQGSDTYSSWGHSVVTKGGESAFTQHDTTARGTVGSAQSSTGGRVLGVSTESGNSAVGKTGNADLYAGHDGNVYKNTGSGWERYDNGNWSSVEKPAPASRDSAQPQARPLGAANESFQQQAQQRSASFERQGGNDDMQRLQQEALNRQRGAQTSQRFEDFQRSAAGRTWGGRGHSWGGGFAGGRSFGGRRR